MAAKSKALTKSILPKDAQEIKESCRRDDMAKPGVLLDIYVYAELP